MNMRLAPRGRRLLMGTGGGLLLAIPALLSAQSPALTQRPVVDPAVALREAVDRELQLLHGPQGEPATAAARHSAYANKPPQDRVANEPATQFSAPIIQQTAGVREQAAPTVVLAQAQQPAAPANSEVLRELQKLYREEGKQMPAMHPDRLPNTVNGPKTVGQTPQVHVRPAQPGDQKRGVAGFFRKLNPFAKSQPQAATRPQPTPQPVARHATTQPGFVHRPPAQPEPQPTTSVASPIPRELPLEVRNAGAAPRAGAQSLARPNVRPLSPPPGAQPARIPPVAQARSADEPVATLADDLGDPFSELSESEADQQANPFSGERLSDAPTNTNAEETKPSITPRQTSVEPEADPRQVRIAERAGTGFKGFCPVALRDQRQLADADSRFFTVVEGRTYRFSSAEAKATFDAHPEQYLPVAGGKDPFLLDQAKTEVEGSLDHAVWFRNRLHLFSSPATLAAFAEQIDLDAE